MGSVNIKKEGRRKIFSFLGSQEAEVFVLTCFGGTLASRFPSSSNYLRIRKYLKYAPLSFMYNVVW